ncbi:MAG: thioesterase family protein, partial [Myxococcales bacterium]|nr:thioesterase family protein [Myxococcales bacterium]
MNRFERDTQIEALGDGAFQVEIDRGWWIVRGPNGGYIAALILRALEAAVDDPSRIPRSLTVHFTSPPAAGAATVRTSIERAGRSLTTASARLEQDGKLRALAVAAFSKARPGPEFDHLTMPDVPPPEACEILPGPGEGIISLRQRY